MMRTTRYLLTLSSMALLLAACGPRDVPLALTGPGQVAADLLSHETYQDLVIEVDFFGSTASSTVVRDLILREVRQTLGKPGEVTAEIHRPYDSYIPWPKGADENELKQLEAAFRDTKSENAQASIYTLFLPGRWHQDSDERRILGVAFGPSSLALFPEAIQANCRTGVAQIEDPEAQDLLCPFTETATWLHEFGHLLGLVNHGVPMVNDHQDEEHGHHCDNERCIMHWSHESGDVARFIERRLKEGKTDLEVFDEDCRADLEAFR